MKNQYVFLALITTSLIGCSTDHKADKASSSNAAKYKTSHESCYDGFIAETTSLIPEDSTYCGIFRSSQKNPPIPCSMEAVKSGKPFIFGYETYGDDSRYCHAAARQADGQILDIFYDSGVRSEYAFLQISRCQKIEFRKGTVGYGSYFDTDECTDAKDLVQAIINRRKPK